jgi:hypothetical protein
MGIQNLVGLIFFGGRSQSIMVQPLFSVDRHVDDTKRGVCRSPIYISMVI